LDVYARGPSGLNLRPWEALFVDRLVYASIVASAVSYGEKTSSRECRYRLSAALIVFKALCGFSGQVLLSAMTFLG
jgi:hypothetical protein